MSCSLEIDKSISWDSSARRGETSRCVLGGRVSRGAFAAAAELRCSGANGFGAMLKADLRPTARTRISLEGGIGGFGAQDTAATLLCTVRAGTKDRTFSLQMGVDGWQPGGQNLLEHLRLSLAWSTSFKEQTTDHRRGGESL